MTIHNYPFFNTTDFLNYLKGKLSIGPCGHIPVAVGYEGMNFGLSFILHGSK
jgi:hypothetical protein